MHLRGELETEDTGRREALVGPLPRASAGRRRPRPARPLWAPGQGTEPQPLSLDGAGSGWGGRWQVPWNPALPGSSEAGKRPYTRPPLCSALLAAPPAPPSAQQPLPEGRWGQDRGRQASVHGGHPSWGHDPHQGREAQPHTSGPCSEALRAPGLGLYSVLGDWLAPPRPQFPCMYHDGRAG